MTQSTIAAPSAAQPAAPRENWVNAPNLITISRLVLAVFLFALISLWRDDGCGIAAGILFAIAVLTDGQPRWGRRVADSRTRAAPAMKE